MKTTSKMILKINASEFGLTEAQLKIYKAIEKRHRSYLITTRADIERDLGGLDKSWVCRILRILSSKGLVERYSQRYYRIANNLTA